MRQAWFVNRGRVPRRRGIGHTALPAAALSMISAPAFAQATAGGPVPWPFWGMLAALFVGVGAALYWITQERRRAEDQRERIMGVLEAATVASLVTGPDRKAGFATPAWQRLAPFDPDDPLAALLGRFNDGDHQAVLGRLRGAAVAGTEAHAELRLADGSWRAVSVRPLAGRPGHAVWNARDLSHRYATERTIGGETEKLIDLIDATPVGFYSVDQDGYFIAVSATLAGWLGETPDDLVGAGRRLADIVDGPESASPHSPFPAGAAGPGGEVTLQGRDGCGFTAEITETVIERPDGSGFHVRALVRHVAAEREARAALRLSEERFKRFFEEAPVGIALLDRTGTVTECNTTFAATLGADLERSTGRALAEFAAPADRARVTAWLRAAIDGPDMPGPLEISLGAADGSAVSLFAGRLGDGSGEASGIIVHVLDLSEQRALEAQFFQSQKMELVGQLAGGIAHDFNNLLTAMIGFCDLLLERFTVKDPSHPDLMQIKQNANRAANLVRQLLAFSRQQTLQPKILNMTDVLAELSHLLRRLIGARIELTMTHGRDLGLVRVDQGQFEQVVINLAVNARDAMADGGTLTIRTTNIEPGDPRLAAHSEVPDGEYVGIEIADTGSGIPKEHLDKIYEPFFTTKEVGSGTGLGLATVYGIIKQTGGYIYVESEPGQGALFSIFLPRHRPDAAEVAAAAAEAGKIDDRRDLTGVGTVLLVEDEDAVRLFGARALRNKGYKVIEAVDGEDALGILDAGDKAIDLLITDVVMPGVDGPTLIRSVRETHPKLKVIFISGYAEDTFRQRIDDGAFVHFLPKPFSLQQLAGKVKEVMHHDAG